MDKKHDRVPMDVPATATTGDFGAKNEKAKAQPRCSSPLPSDRNMAGSGEKK